MGSLLVRPRRSHWQTKFWSCDACREQFQNVLKVIHANRQLIDPGAILSFRRIVRKRSSTNFPGNVCLRHLCLHNRLMIRLKRFVPAFLGMELRFKKKSRPCERTMPSGSMLEGISTRLTRKTGKSEIGQPFGFSIFGSIRTSRSIWLPQIGQVGDCSKAKSTLIQHLHGGVPQTQTSVSISGCCCWFCFTRHLLLISESYSFIPFVSLQHGPGATGTKKESKWF
jgi:hypothetical protein